MTLAMSRSAISLVLALSFTSLGFPAQVLAAVHAVFEFATPATGPFPSDWFTVPDASHNTRRRVNLPLPNCAVRPSDCEDLKVINTLDGFSADPRLSIPFDGPIRSRLRYEAFRGLTRSFSLAVSISKSQVHLTSCAVNGLPRAI